jgi:hypothetical protein
VVSAAVAVARQPTGAMPVHAAVAASAPAVIPQHVDELDWSDDESATQIMDKPGDMVAALVSAPRPAARGSAVPAAPASASLPPRPGRLTGQLPALPALPGRQPSMTALGVAPPATSLPPVSAAPVVSAPPVAAPAVAAPLVSAPPVAAPVVNARPVSSVPSPAMPSGRPGDAFNNLAPGFSPAATAKPAARADWPAGPTSTAPAAQQKPARDTRSTALLAFFGVIAVAALVVLALQLKGSPQATLVITTTDGAEVSVDSRPIPGLGGRYEVAGLDPQQPHTIEIRKSGFESVTQTQEVMEGNNNLRFVLREMPAPSIAVPPPVEQPIAPPPPPPVVAQVPAAQPIAPPPPVVQPQVAPPPPPPPPPVVAAAPERPRVRDTAPRPARPPREPVVRPTIPTPPAPQPAALPVASSGGANGTLLLSTTPASQCTVNGMTHSTPWRVSLAAGRYAIRCVNADLASSATFNVTIVAGQTADYRNRALE